MYETVLLPTDRSEAMETVVEHASDIASRRDAEVHVLYVVDDRAFLTLAEDRIPEVTDELREEGERATEEAAAALDRSLGELGLHEWTFAPRCYGICPEPVRR